MLNVIDLLIAFFSYNSIVQHLVIKIIGILPSCKILEKDVIS